MGILAWIVLGLIAGVIAQFLVGGGYGIIGSIVLGIVGAVVGGFIAGLITGGNDYITGINLTTIIVAVIGAVVVVLGYNALTGRTRAGRGPI